MYVNATAELVTLAPGLRPLARGLKCILKCITKTNILAFDEREINPSFLSILILPSYAGNSLAIFFTVSFICETCHVHHQHSHITYTVYGLHEMAWLFK